MTKLFMRFFGKNCKKNWNFLKPVNNFNLTVIILLLQNNTNVRYKTAKKKSLIFSCTSKFSLTVRYCFCLHKNFHLDFYRFYSNFYRPS